MNTITAASAEMDEYYLVNDLKEEIWFDLYNTNGSQYLQNKIVLQQPCYPQIKIVLQIRDETVLFKPVFNKTESDFSFLYPSPRYCAHQGGNF